MPSTRPELLLGLSYCSSLQYRLILLVSSKQAKRSEASLSQLMVEKLTFSTLNMAVYALVSCSRRTVHSHNTPESFEEVVFSAFGMKGKNFTMFLVFLTTYIAVIAYAILLRDIASPLAERAFNGGVKFDDFGRNVCMLLLVLMVTPLMFLRNMTALKPVAMVSMTTIGTLACCIAVRSYQCNFDDINSIDMGDSVVPKREESWQDYVVLFGERKGILDSLPIFICTFVCHFNVLPVHGELRKVSPFFSACCLIKSKPILNCTYCMLSPRGRG